MHQIPVLCVHKAFCPVSLHFPEPWTDRSLSEQVLGHPPQSNLSRTASHYHIRVPLWDDRTHHSISHLSFDATPRDDYIASRTSTLALSTNPSPSLCTPENMSYRLDTEMSQVPYFHSYTVSSNKGGVRTHGEAPCRDAHVLDPLYGVYDGADFMQDVPLFDTADPQLSSLWDFSFEHTLQNPPSPISRSMSRSSFCSTLFADAYSPYPEDYPTPTSDSSVTTPAPSEACLGMASERPVVFGCDFTVGLDAKSKGEHELCYVPGSAPLSPNGSFSIDLQQPQLIPAAAAARFAEARRHSEPANVAAMHFVPFFASSLEVPPQIVTAPVPADFLSMTLPITDNLASTSAASGSHSALPSSIAPHQTQLPSPLELKQPKPVRGFKPPILLSGYQYDPKEFVRRHSEPILPLPDLDIASHLPLDVSLESDEDDDSMEIDEGVYQNVHEDDVCAEESIDLDPTAFEGIDMDAFLFDSSLPWGSTGSSSAPTVEDLSNHVLQWAAANAASFPIPGLDGSILLDPLFNSN
ncbi:hypothetical protein C8Q74DRAFT_1238798 [Fomes fomentarius]|nr:hypothetical protein C8Q74DRAFT_1238798 [Fomes fomentarius]